jgi:[ribosomal protein S5]-alanine N-acetyltransferase
MPDPSATNRIFGASNPEPYAIRTLRLDLLPVTSESLLSQVGFGPATRSSLGSILDAQIPEEWPPEHWESHVLDYLLNLIATHPDSVGWVRYLLLRPGSSAPQASGRILIGTVGSGFPKPETGEAEVGYGILPSWQRRGFAPEALEALLPWLASQSQIRAFVAQTYPHLRGSIRVLEKCGFSPAGAGFEEGTILFRRLNL